MFTGIIETLGQLKRIEREGTNIHFTLQTSFATELSIDQSVAHDGVCLTVVELLPDSMYRVTAIHETLLRSRLGSWKVDDFINLERCMKLGDRLDGHIVQGHVDTIGICTHIEDFKGSIQFHFQYDASHLTVEKGSITVNGVSLTVVDSSSQSFSVSIIPYTLEHTNFKQLKVGDTVNLEFDILGKYFQKQMEIFKNSNFK